jgi:hypothetical protein
MYTSVTPAVPYLLLGLQDVQWAVGNSRGARKLAQTPHVNKKKIYAILNVSHKKDIFTSNCMLSQFFLVRVKLFLYCFNL